MLLLSSLTFLLIVLSVSAVQSPSKDDNREKINGEIWLQNHLWFPNDPRGSWIDDNDDDDR